MTEDQARRAAAKEQAAKDQARRAAAKEQASVDQARRASSKEQGMLSKQHSTELNAGSPSGNPGFSQAASGNTIWVNEGTPTQDDKTQFANWSNSQNGGMLSPDFNVTTLQDEYKQQIADAGPNVGFSDSFMKVADGTDSYLGQSYQKSIGQDNRTPGGGMLDTPVDLDFGVGQSTKMAQEEEIKANAKKEQSAERQAEVAANKAANQAHKARKLEKYWEENPEALVETMQTNPTEFGYNKIEYNDQGVLVGKNADGHQILQLENEFERFDYTDASLKAKTNDEWGLDTRPPAPEDTYVPYRPSGPEATEKDIKQWHSYYRNNEDALQFMSVDEQSDFYYLEHLTGNLTQEELQAKAKELRGEMPRHASVPGRDSHRFEFQFDSAGKEGETAYDTFLRASDEVGGYYKQKDLPGGSFFQDDILGNPIIRAGAAYFTSGLSEVAIAAGKALDGETLHGMDYANVVAAVAPVAGGWISELAKGAISPTIAAGGVTAAATGIAGGDMEDVAKSFVTNVASNTVANLIKGNLTGKPSSEVLNDVLPDGVAEPVGEFIDDMFGTTTEQGWLSEKLNLPGDKDFVGDGQKFETFEDFMAAEPENGYTTWEEKLVTMGAPDEVLKTIMDNPVISKGLDALFKTIQSEGGSGTKDVGDDPFEGIEVGGGYDQDEQKKEEPEVESEVEESEVTDEVTEDPDIQTPPDDYEDPFEDTTATDIQDDFDFEEDPDIEGEVIVDPNDEDPVITTPADGLDGADGEDGKSFASGGGGTDAEWSELFPYTKLTPLQKKKLRPMLNDIRSAKA